MNKNWRRVFFFFPQDLSTYSWEREREAEREAGSMQGARPTWDSILGLQDHPCAECSTKPLTHQDCPKNLLLVMMLKFY